MSAGTLWNAAWERTPTPEKLPPGGMRRTPAGSGNPTLHETQSRPSPYQSVATGTVGAKGRRAKRGRKSYGVSEAAAVTIYAPTRCLQISPRLTMHTRCGQWVLRGRRRRRPRSGATSESSVGGERGPSAGVFTSPTGGQRDIRWLDASAIVSVRLRLVSSLIGHQSRPSADAALVSNQRPALASAR